MLTKPPFWRDARTLAILAQIFVVVVVALALLGATTTLRRSFIRHNIRLDWSVFSQPAGFELSALQWTLDLDTLRVKRYEPTDSNAEAIIAGLINTIQVAVIGIALATLVGVVVGAARLSPNWLVARIALGFVDGLRNPPLRVAVFFWDLGNFLQPPDGSFSHPPLPPPRVVGPRSHFRLAMWRSA